MYKKGVRFHNCNIIKMPSTPIFFAPLTVAETRLCVVRTLQWVEVVICVENERVFCTAERLKGN